MNSIRTIYPPEYPKRLREMEKLPARMYVRGELPPEDYRFVTVVGSRRYTEYGKMACQKLVASLAGLPVVIVSGLAYGIDSIAHRTALDCGIRTIAVPGSGLDDSVIHPRAHLALAHEILERGGALMSPHPPLQGAAIWTFPVRNPIMAGLSDVTLIIEADTESGTMITAKAAQDMHRDVIIVPGSIFCSQNTSPLKLMKDGATPITSPRDFLRELGFDPDVKEKEIDTSRLSPEEIRVVDLLVSPLSRERLIEKLGMETSRVNELISLLELKGLVEERLGELRRV